MTTASSATRTPLWVHSWHCKNDYSNAVGIKEKIEVIEPDGSVRYEDNLRILEDHELIRPFWITKPEFQNHEYKKEFEDLDKCDLHLCKDSELPDRLESALGLFPGFRKKSVRQLCNSPYVYGADMDIQTLIKQSYVRKNKDGKIPVYSIGGLDIESEVTGEKRINAITFVHEYTVYTAAWRPYCKIHSDRDHYVMATEEDCLKVIHEELGDLLDKFTLNFRILDTELELIEWIFKMIHKEKTDFVGVWNMGFDVPKIIERIEANQVEPQAVMCHPDVPRQLRFVKWQEDKAEADHFTDKWHTSSIAGYTRFIDSMCLYARLRKVSGRASSYALDAVSQNELKMGKQKIDTAITNHWYAQNFQFLRYIAYNIKDVLLMRLMEVKNKDINAVTGLTGMSRLEHFSRQTTMVRNSAYDYAKSRGKVISATGMSGFNEYDKIIPKAGGAVLPPNKAVNVSVSVVEELPGHPTQVSLLSNDLDVSSMYPSITSAFNISKETILSTVLGINGFTFEETETYFSGINRPDINAVPLCVQFFGFPTYREMDDIYSSHLRTATLSNGRSFAVGQ